MLRSFRLAASGSLFAASALSQSVTTSTISVPVCVPTVSNDAGNGGSGAGWAGAGIYGGNATTSASTGLSSGY